MFCYVLVVVHYCRVFLWNNRRINFRYHFNISGENKTWSIKRKTEQNTNANRWITWLDHSATVCNDASAFQMDSYRQRFVA